MCVDTYACKRDPILTLKVLQSMSEFGGLRKHQNNPACTKSVKSLHNVEAGHHEKDERKKKEGEKKRRSRTGLPQ